MSAALVRFLGIAFIEVALAMQWRARGISISVCCSTLLIGAAAKTLRGPIESNAVESSARSHGHII